MHVQPRRVREHVHVQESDDRLDFFSLPIFKPFPAPVPIPAPVVDAMAGGPGPPSQAVPDPICRGRWLLRTNHCTLLGEPPSEDRSDPAWKDELPPQRPQPVPDIQGPVESSVWCAVQNLSPTDWAWRGSPLPSAASGSASKEPGLTELASPVCHATGALLEKPF